MFNRVSTRLSVRLFVVSLLIVAITTVSATASWTDYINPFSYFAKANESTAAEPSSESTNARLFTAGTCDLGNNPLLPMEVESSGGTLAGTPTGYATLRAAFIAINGGTLHTGTITIDVCENSDEGVNTASIAGGNDAGTADYTSITISPAGGAARTITGATTAGNSTILFSGADNVTIDGLNSGGNSLTIQNTTVASTANTSTIRFVDAATSNTINRASVLGSFTGGTGAAGGTIYFSGDAVPLSGNDGNTISNSNIGPAGANLPTTAIYSAGTSTAVDNSGNTISGNNIFDYFGAGVVTAGINLTSTGNSAWTIQNNRLYQTATRVYTTGNTHSGIQIGTGSAYSITGNIIGFANSTGTGTTNLVGNSVALTGTFPSSYTTTGTANTTRYIAINAAFTAAGTVSEIQNNTIAGFALYTSSGATTTNGILCGIAITSGNANVGTTVGNTIGTATGSMYTAATNAGGLIAGIYATSTNTVTIQNNAIQNFDAMGTTASVSGSVNGINTAGTAGNFVISGNTIGGSSNPSFRMGTLTTGANLSNVGATYGVGSGASIFQGILNSATGTVTIGTVTLPNTIRNASANSTSTSARVSGIQTSAGTNTIDSNSISNLTTPSANVSASSSPAAVGIHLSITGLTHSITRNTIRDISSTAATAAVYVDGIYIGTTPGTTISKNSIYNLTTTSTSATSSINGILLFNSAATINIYNNMMRLGLGVGNNPIIRGIYDNSATSSPTNIIHNSIYVDGTQGGATVNTSCIAKVVSSTMTVTNNILWNNRASTGSPGSNAGRHYGINTTSGNPTSNYNDIYTPSLGGAIGFSTSDRLTLANWQSGTLQDLNSQNSNPQFQDPTNATTPDLHINPLITTLVEGNGILVGAPTDDFDGQTRSGLTPVDIGADAGNFMGVDLTAPAIGYTALGNTTGTGDRTLIITVTDATGVPTAGLGLPVIYYRKNAGAYVSTQCTFVSGSSYSCSLVATSLGGLVATDTVSYYVAAQDTAPTPNVTTNPSVGAGGFSASPPAASTPPTTPNSYLIAAAITGTKTVCASGCDYTTLTGATGVFNAINTGVATGNINIEIGGDLTTGETGATALNALVEEPSGSNFAVKIYPTGSSRAITSTTAPTGGFIRLNAADRVTIDGSIGGSGTDRSLTITEANTGATSAVVWLQSSGADGAQDNVIRNLNIVGNSSTTTLIGIGMGTTGTSSVSATSLGTNNNNNTIHNNNISKVQYGIYSQGAAIGTKNTGNTISQNLMNTASPNQVLKSGILVGFENNITISQNTISGITGVSSSYAWGISLGLTGTTTTTTTGNEVTNATVSRNVIGSVRAASTFGVAGIMVASAATGTNAITNNVVYDANSNGTLSDIAAGIYVGGGAGSTQIYFNSVQMAGTLTGGAYGSFGVAINGSNPIVDMRNNAITSTGSTGANQNRAIGLAYSTFTNLTSNNNALFVSGTTAAVGQTGTLSNSGGTISTTLANWQTNSGKDGASVGANPLFNSATDLRPQLGSPLLNAGVNGTGITIDILGVSRSATPTIGAYEAAVDGAGPTIVYTSFGNTTSTSNRTLSASITDPSTVASGADAPRIYFKKSTDASYVSTQCTGSYSCDIDYSLVGGSSVTTGDIVQYFVVAQDIPGNVSSNPSTGFVGSSVNSVTTPPTTPNSYQISTGYAGIYNVGSAETVTSLTNSGGLFQLLNSGVLTGNITVNITSNLTGETGTFALNQQAEEGGGAGTYTITIKPSGAARSITSTTGAVGLISLNGADRVTIDGSLSGGTDRSLTLFNQNSTTSGTTVVGLFSSGIGAGATNNTIKNTIIQNGAKFEASTSSFNFGIYAGSGASATSADIDNLSIQNNLIQRCNIGIQAIGFTGGALDNLDIEDNTVGGAVLADYFGLDGVIVGNANGASITRNTVRNALFTAALDGGGIFLSAGTVNSSVTRNTVNNLEASNSGGYGMTGIYIVTGTASSNNTVANNFVYDIRGTSWTTGVLGDTVAGIRVAGTGTGGINIWNNSVNLFGNYAGASGSATVTAAFMVNGTTITGLNVRNNIFVNTFDNTAGSGDKSYAIYTSTSNTMFSAIDNNDYVVAGAAPGVLGAINAVDATSLGSLATASSGDTNSKNISPSFTSSTNLHLSDPTNAVVSAGVAIGAVTVDFDGDPRPASNPDIGADEIVQSVGGIFPAGTFYNGATTGGDVLGGNVTFTNALTLNGILTTIVPDPPNSDIVYVLTLGCGVTSVGNANSLNYIVGSVNKQYCGPANFTYPVGRGGFYSPANVDVTAVGVNPSSLTVRPHDALLVGFDPLETLTRNWQLDEVGDITANLLFYYDDSDVNGNESDYRVWRREGTGTDTNMCAGGPCVDTVNNILGPVNGVTTFSRWTGSKPLAPTSSAASVSGRVVTASGQGIRGAAIVITGNSLPTPIIAKTGSLGYFQIDNLDTGQTYVVTIVSKRFTFSQPSRVINLTDSINDVDFIANPLE